MTRVSSSNVKNATYNANTQELDIEFHGGSRYTYHGASPELYRSLMQSESKGKFVHAYIKRLPFTKR